MNGLLLSFPSPLGQRTEALEQDIEVAERIFEVERRGQRRRVQAGGDLGIRRDELQVALLVPGGEGVSLDETVGLVLGSPEATRARRTRWLKTRPWDASRFRRIRSASTTSPLASQAKRSSM